jgi:hypothetical protein
MILPAATSHNALVAAVELASKLDAERSIIQTISTFTGQSHRFFGNM